MNSNFVPLGKAGLEYFVSLCQNIKNFLEGLSSKPLRLALRLALLQQ
jgi:hypothetical protein